MGDFGWPPGREAYPALLPDVFSDIDELTNAIANNPILHDAGSSGKSSSSNDHQPDTEGRAHQGSRREHVLSVVLWDSGHQAYQSVSEAFGGFIILADGASTPSHRTESNLLLAASSFQRVLGAGRGAAKCGGNILQRVDRILKSSVDLADVHGRLIALRQQFPDEEGVALLVHGMALIIEMLPKFASGSAKNAEEGDVRLPRLFMRITKQSTIDTWALNKALYEDGSILSAQAERSERNEPQGVDLYAVFSRGQGSESDTYDLVDRYLKLELQSKTWGCAAVLEAIRPGSGEYLAADCRYRLGMHLQEEVDNDSCSIGGLILLLVMFLNKDPDSIYDTHCGFECAIQPEGRIRRSELAIEPSGALENAPSDTVRYASDTMELYLPSLPRAFVHKYLSKCKWGETVGAHLGLTREQFLTEYENKVLEIKAAQAIHELRVDGMSYQLGRFAYNGCRSTSVINSLYGRDHYVSTNSAHYVWIGDGPLSGWYRDVGDAYFRGDEAPPILDFKACANSQSGIGATVPEISHLGRFIQLKQRNLKRLRKKRRTKRIEYLNELAQFVQFLLQCVTSCHENNDAFALFSVRTSRYENFTTLADKVSHYFDDGRLVVFTDVVRLWVEHYLAEISHLVPWLENMGAEESALYLRSLLQSMDHKTLPGIPFFFQMDEHSHATIRLTAGEQREWLGDEFKWGNVDELRKILGTYLFEQGVSQDLMNLQMGHIVGGVHPFNSSSFWCVSQAGGKRGILGIWGGEG